MSDLVTGKVLLSVGNGDLGSVLSGQFTLLVLLSSSDRYFEIFALLCVVLKESLDG